MHHATNRHNANIMTPIAAAIPIIVISPGTRTPTAPASFKSPVGFAGRVVDTVIPAFVYDGPGPAPSPLTTVASTVLLSTNVCDENGAGPHDVAFAFWGSADITYVKFHTTVYVPTSVSTVQPLYVMPG